MNKPKWYHETSGIHDVVVASRVRVSRNLEGCEFPEKLQKEECRDLIDRILPELSELGTTDGRTFNVTQLEDTGELLKNALFERRTLNKQGVETGKPAALLCTEDEQANVLLMGDDHFRIQVMKPGGNLESIYREVSTLEDHINERFPFAFHEKYGYLTSYPTNMGTGLRAGITLHLPMLAAGKQFARLVNEMSRFGISVRGLYGDGAENHGSIFEVINQKTLGSSEEEILSLVRQMADRLVLSERKIKELTIRDHRLDLVDEIYKSYGVLKYAKKLSLKEAMIYLSKLRLGQAEGLIRFAWPVNFYGLMLEIQPANLRLIRDFNEKEDYLEGAARAAYIRKRLPELY